MKKMKKVALLLVSVMLVSVLGGCGASFDAGAYMKAVLDNSYKNNSADFVKMKVGTKEEAAKVYEQGIDAEMAAMGEIPEDLEGDFRQVMQDLLKQVKYTVGEAEKQDDGSYVVTIKYQKLVVFAPALELFTAKQEAYVADMTKKAESGEEVPSEEEMTKEVLVMLKDSLQEALTDVKYEDEATTTVKIELIDKVYTPNETDVTNLEAAMIDVDGFSQ